MATEEQWKKRISTRCFDQENMPDIKLIEEIETCLNFLPIQISENNSNKPNYVVFRLNPDDKQLKEFLVRNVFNINDDYGPEEYFTELVDAPYTYIFVRLDIGKHSPIEPNSNILFRNVGVAVGALVAEAVSRDIDICQIACTGGYPIGPKENSKVDKRVSRALIKRFHKEMNYFKKTYGEKLKFGRIEMGIGLGFRKILDDASYIQYHKELELPTVFQSKLPDRKYPFMFVRDV